MNTALGLDASIGEGVPTRSCKNKSDQRSSCRNGALIGVNGFSVSMVRDF
jgi:hypothetical protein